MNQGSSGEQAVKDHNFDTVAVFTAPEPHHPLRAKVPLEIMRDSDADAFRSATAVSALDTTSEEIWQNQRKPVLGSLFSAAQLLSIERPEWSDEKGRPRIKRNIALPPGFVWQDREWAVDTSGLCDEDGWS
jgi:hypothetical protein